ncbi:MAG TPA: serine/threonine-protein kinase [Kofleriaceae bacterium]|nr:serine/threonine-protein kinase [Kofleriaceae bacterium]
MKPAQERSRQLAPGDRLGKYDLIRQIAIGGMAELYLARTVGIEGFEKLVVLKRILPMYAVNASIVEMFLNEARLAATLHHPNVAQVYDIGVEAGDYFFAMEYVHGEDLSRIAVTAHEQGVPISMDAALTLVAGLCAGLHYAHDKAAPDGSALAIVHRDVSPSNVLVSYDGSVKLVDFGIARAATRQTTQSGLKGKIVYMSPEQCRSDMAIDRRSDIYSVGTLLYELTCGRLPFAGETDYAILNQIVNTNVPPPSAIVRDYPAALERIVLRALSRDPVQRYATARELHADIEDFAHENRLRISPLVLGRLMGTLFPERIEEWASAKAQGAFFVEQHVVRTLIEAGKTPDPESPQVRAAVARAEEIASQRDDAADTAVGPPPMIGEPDTGRIPTPVPGPGYMPDVPAPVAPAPRLPSPVPGAIRVVTPAPPPVVPGMPGAVPIVMLPAATAGTLVSSSTPPAMNALAAPPAAIPVPAAAVADVTERVHVARTRVQTTLVPKRRRSRALAILAGIAVAGGGAAAVIALQLDGGGSAPATTAPAKMEVRAPEPVAAPAPPPPSPAPPPPAPAVDEVAAPAPAPAPEPEPAKPHPRPAGHKVAHAARPHPKPKAAETRPADQPPEPAEPAKEPTWNADSPLMPVREH